MTSEERAWRWLERVDPRFRKRWLDSLTALLREVRDETERDIRNEPMNKEHYARLVAEERERVLRIVREVLIYSCSCDEAYKMRGLTDPHCSGCESVEDLAEIERRVKGE